MVYGALHSGAAVYAPFDTLRHTNGGWERWTPSGGWEEFGPQKDKGKEKLKALDPTKEKAIRNALKELAAWLKTGKISEDCQKNVIDKLDTLDGFDLDKFIDFLDKGGSFYDGKQSYAPATDYFPDEGYSPKQTVADTWKEGLSARVSKGSKISTFTVFFDPNAINRGEAKSLISGQKVSGIKSDNLAFILHESLHGYGVSIGTFKAGKENPYSDRGLQTLFFGQKSEKVGAESVNITEYIEKHCFN